MIYAELAPLVFAAIIVLMVPGLLVSWAAGARGWVLAGSAGPVSVSVISVTAILTGFAGLPWGMVVVLAVSAVLAAAIFVLRRVLPRSLREHGAPLPAAGSVHGRAPGHGHRYWADMLIAWFVVVVVFLVLFWCLGQIFGNIENISQTFDNVFHLNAVRYIVDTGNASSLRVSGFTSSTGIGGFYPAAWHDVASLTQQLTGSTVPAAVNASNVAIAALVWPLSCLLLATASFGRRRIVVVAAAAFSAGLGSFPYLMLDFGVLYPNLLSIALLPAGIGPAGAGTAGCPRSGAANGICVDPDTGLPPGRGAGTPQHAVGVAGVDAPDSGGRCRGTVSALPEAIRCMARVRRRPRACHLCRNPGDRLEEDPPR